MRISRTLAAATGLFIAVVTNCDAPEEYMASSKDFRDYRSWRVIDYSIGQSNPLLGGAHRGADERYSRRIYLSPGAKRNEGGYVVGTMIVKETYTWANGKMQFSPTDGLLAMVKRDRPFDPREDALSPFAHRRFNIHGNGWEWIFLSPDRTRIVSRGGSEMGLCNTCHRYAAAQGGGADFVFAYPTEFEYTGESFSRYLLWHKVDERHGPDPFLREIEGVVDSSAVRRIYKKQLLANPDTDSLGYPAGSIFFKEIRREGFVVTLLAKVKRGGRFNPEYGNWEWFIVEPASFRVKERGAYLGDGACNRCHAGANKPGKGRDFVFRHPGDPFNK